MTSEEGIYTTECPSAIVTKFAFKTPHWALLSPLGARNRMAFSRHPRSGSHGSFGPIPVNQGLFAPLVPIIMIEIEMHTVDVWGKIMPSSVPSLRFSSPYSPLTSLFLKIDSGGNDGESSTITTHRFRQGEFRATTSRETLPGLLGARCHQRRPPHQESLCRQASGARRVDGSEGAMPSRPCRVRQARVCTGSLHLGVHSLVTWKGGGIF